MKKLIFTSLLFVNAFAANCTTQEAQATFKVTKSKRISPNACAYSIKLTSFNAHNFCALNSAEVQSSEVIDYVQDNAKCLSVNEESSAVLVKELESGIIFLD